ncbi:MAG TPA: 4-alpha-glucanotransferase [Thermoanaerobaculia bacterium]|nr:4-alpha-glucanotransferase [Thermoanaerobaculia bacterium]
MSEAPSPELLELARGCGVETVYRDAWGAEKRASAEALTGVLASLGLPLARESDAAAVLAERRAERALRLAEPVVVAWDGQAPVVPIRLPAGAGRVSFQLELETGERWSAETEASRLSPGPSAGELLLPVADSVPIGHHRLAIEAGGRRAEVAILAAPPRTYPLGSPGLWGTFLPLYALRTADSWGAADFTDLESLARFTEDLGGGVVATLPLLATFLDEPFEPSPYAPASRLFWNEAYVDPRRLPELERSPAARALIENGDFLAEAAELAALPAVDWARYAALKRRVLAELARALDRHDGPRRSKFERFVAEKPYLAEYASFRAVGERRGASWQAWPEPLRGGEVGASDFDEETRRYHLFAQFAAEEQLAEMARGARQRGPGLYLDLPLGVHASAFDVWRFRDLFATGVAAGAPPDALFQGGQNWGFPPIQPERHRERGYDYLIASLRHHLAHAGVLRIDHVMQLHRLYWVPEGQPATEGVYVTYPAEELYAVLSLESHRHRSALVGENLGTVPQEVYEAMDRHGIPGLFVVQYELDPDASTLVREPPAHTAASLNTHDMPTLRAFWEGRDIDDLAALGAVEEAVVGRDRARRERLRGRLLEAVGAADAPPGAGYGRVLEALLEHIAASPAALALVSLEDLWRETEPQNVPGTHTERPNWRRKARYTLAEIAALPQVRRLLARVEELRASRRPG